MTFFESIKIVLRKYAEFGGRATRPEFWWFALFNALVTSAFAALNVTQTTNTWEGNGMLGYGMPNMFDFDGSAMTSTIYLGTALASVWSLIVLLPSLAVTIRRLRDAGRGWANIFWVLLPIAGVIVLIAFLVEPTKSELPVAPAAPPAAAVAPAAPAATPPAAPAAPPVA